MYYNKLYFSQQRVAKTMNNFFSKCKIHFWAGIRPEILYQAVPSEARGSVV